MNPKMSQLRKKAMALPLLPGVEIMHDKSGKIIYIGKAKALKNRVSQTILTLSPENLISWSILQHLVILMGRVRPLQEAPVDKSKI